MKERLAPFLVLLEARYAPLLFAVAPQAYAVYLWLMPQPYDRTGEFFAVMGGIGYEFIYVGAIAWAEEGKWSFWTWATAVIALLFSMAVAYYVYRTQGAWAWLHAGFPLVAFGYTMNMHAPAVKTRANESDPDSAPQSKTALVKALALEKNISESTAWRKVKAGELSLNGKEH
jgi:hypothetical protein